MKYSEKNKPVVCMQTQSSCYKGTTKMQVKGVLWHSTGANNPTIKRYVQPSDNDPNKVALLNLIGKNKNGNDWNHVARSAGLNCWIGKLADGTVAAVQTMPWDYRSWGCGSGSKGSCNNGWVQFEICEDALTDKAYFEKVYREACEITAYLCKLYNIDPHGTMTDNGVKIPTILCHYDSYKLGFGSGHSDVTHWFPKFGKSMETARNDVAALLKSSDPTSDNTSVAVIYRVRKSWDDAASQIGAFSILDHAKALADENPGYTVYDKDGVAVYSAKPEIKTEQEEEDNMRYYEKLNDVPKSYRPTIRKLMEKGALEGYDDPDPNSLEDNIISVSEDLCRMLTILDRLGKLD